MKYFITTFLFVSLALTAGLYAVIAFFGKDLPSPKGTHEIERSLATRVLDCRGRLLADLSVEERVLLRMDEVPPYFIDAVLAVEDRKFYKHWGLDPVGIVRAMKANLQHRRIVQGGSTITQQLAWNLFLDHRRTIKRKIREAVLALRLERSFSKDEILELYINQIYFGEGAYGLEAAARHFFGVSAKDLSLAQCALLAGLPANPARFSPRHHPRAALSRRNHVLKAMLVTGAIDEETYREAAEAPLQLRQRESESETGRHGQYFVEMVRRELAARYGADQIYRAGFVVETALDLDLQETAEAALEDHLSYIEKRNRYPYLYGRSMDSLLVRAGLPSQIETEAPLRLQGAVVGIEPSTGAVRIMIGGRDFIESPFNRAVQAKRQPASAFKPFIYAEAIRQGMRSTDILFDAPVEFEIPGAPESDTIWAPRNFKETYYGPVTLRYALAKSINVPTARLLAAIGVDNVVNLAHRMGIGSRLPRVLSLATGTGEVSLMEMVSAYSVFPNHGIRVEPYLIERVLDRHGNVIWEHESESEQVLDERTAFITLSMMRSVLDHGTGRTARTIHGFTAPAGGKTGTNDDYSDAWFIGFVPDLTVGVWVGFDLKIPIGDKRTGTGAMAALPIWSKIMKRAVAEFGEKDFEVPSGLVMRKTCLETGFLAGPGCPITVEDYFIPGTEPRQVCHIHRGGGTPAVADFETLDRLLVPLDSWNTPFGTPP